MLICTSGTQALVTTIWLAAHPSLCRRFGPEDLETGRYELTGAVFVQADCRDAEALDEVGWVERLAEAHPFVCGIVAYAPLQRGRAAERDVARLAERPLVVGVRRLLQGKPVEAITAPAFVRGVRMLSEWGLTFDMCVTHDQLPAAAQLVRACPRTAFMLDHLGKPPMAAGVPSSAWCDDLGPVATLRTTIERWFDFVVDVIAELPAGDQAAVLSGTAATIYGLERPTRCAEEADDAGCAVRR
jgi:L-fuconolactonase